MMRKAEYMFKKSTWDRSENTDILCPFCDHRSCSLTEMDTLICRNSNCGRHVNLRLAIEGGNVDFAHIDFLTDLHLHGRNDLSTAIKKEFKSSVKKAKDEVEKQFKKNGNKWQKI